MEEEEQWGRGKSRTVEREGAGDGDMKGIAGDGDWVILLVMEIEMIL